ncbi:MAG: DUF2142 domain-containing protein, partial [Chloroflexota bacterium]|nr:DUF2142 domain-containing protein [Chloroflexota bacterium]
ALGLCMALLPMYVFATATVNNDAAMNLCATAVIWLTVRTYRRRDFPPALALALGVTSGLALLAKPTAAPVVAVAGMVVLIKAFPPPRAPWRVMRAKLLACGAWAAGAGAAYGPWALVRLHYYGDVGFGWAPLAPLIRLLTGGIAVAATSPVSPDGRAFSPSSRVSVAAISLWQFLHLAKDRGWAHYQSLLITGFWGNFGWLDAPLPERVFVPIVVVYIIGGIGMAMQLVLQPKRRGALVLLLGYLLAQSLFLFIGVDYYEGYVRTGAEVGPQGRYFFPILAPLLFLLLSGWDHLCQENSLVLRLAPLGMAWLQVIALATLLLRYYGVALG